MKRIVSLICIALFMVSILCSCAPASIKDDCFIVMVEENDTFAVTDGYSRKVKKGGEAAFRIQMNDNYAYAGNNVGAEYSDGILIFSNVRSDTMIVVNTIKVGSGDGKEDKQETPNGMLYSAEPQEGSVFCGWTYVSGEQKVLYSYCNNLTVEDKTLELRANFVPAEGNTFVTYHVNGGNLYNSSDSMFTVCFESNVYLYPASLGQEFFSIIYRENFVPLEYNTEANGSGTAISLGSRVLVDGQFKNLYVIWAEETDSSQFTYEKAVFGNFDGITIKNYHGNNDIVVVPETIEGLPVVKIQRDCFFECTASTIVLSRNILMIEEGAFCSCNSLETVYLCDGVYEIGDACFVACPSFANLRMIAATAPVHCDNLVASLVRRVEKLYSLRNVAKRSLLFYGGSAMYNGIDGKTINQYFENEFNVLNLGQNANISGIFMLDLYSHFLREGDILVFAPEYWVSQYSNSWQMIDWITIEAYYDALRLIDIREYMGVFDAFEQYQNGSQHFSFDAKREMKKGSYYDYCEGFDEYFTRDYQAESGKLQDMVAGYIDISKLKPVMNMLNSVYRSKILPTKATFYFSYAPFYAKAYNANKAVFADFHHYVSSTLSCKVIGQPIDFWYPLEYFYDSPVHLSSEGAVHNSLVYCSFIEQQLLIDGY